jgi:hypothetical protein
MEKFILAAVFTFTASIGLAPAAYANSDYQFDVTFNNGSATETLNAELIVSGGEVVGITGSLDGLGFTGANADLNGVQNITDFLSNSNFPGTDSIRIDGGTDLIFDNVFNAGSLTDNGIVFELTNGKYINIWENSPGNFTVFVDNYLFQANGDGAFVVPEPSALAMMLTGFFALGGVFLLRRRAGGQTRDVVAI